MKNKISFSLFRERICVSQPLKNKNKKKKMYQTSPSQSPASAIKPLGLLSDAPFWTREISEHELRNTLENSLEKPKLAAMKKALALIAQGADISKLFPSVVKNTRCVSFELKKLVHFFLTHYAATNADLALLSINSFQHDLANSNERVRAAALKAICSMKVPILLNLLLRALQTSYKDTSPYVRKAAALGTIKVFDMAIEAGSDREVLPSILEILSVLMLDHSFLVYPSAIAAVQRITRHMGEEGENLLVSLMHRGYRGYCKYLADLEACFQAIVLRALLVYARKCFADPMVGQVQAQNTVKRESMNYSTFFGDESESPKETAATEEVREEQVQIEPDHALLFDVCSTLSYSQSADVVIACANILLYVAPATEFIKRNFPAILIRLLRNARDRETEHVLLNNISVMINQRAVAFAPYLKQFFIYPSDPLHVRVIKLNILHILVKATPHAAPIVLQELKVYLTDGDMNFIAEVLKCICRIGTSIESAAEVCFSVFMQILSKKQEGEGYSSIIAEVVVSIRRLLKQHVKLHSEIIPKLVRYLDKIDVPIARASIIWIVGEYRSSLVQLAPDVLRKLAKSFKSEAEIVKFQVLNLGVKMMLECHSETADLSKYSDKVKYTVFQLFDYILQLCKYDNNIDLRDRARLFSGLFKDLESSEDILHIKDSMKTEILASRPAPVLEEDFSFKRKSELVFGTISQLVGHSIGDTYRKLPPFPIYPVPSTFRDPIFIQPVPASTLKASVNPRQSVQSGQTAQGFKESDDEWSSDEDKAMNTMENEAKDVNEDANEEFESQKEVEAVEEEDEDFGFKD
jgi:AP-3 complex subunit beta